MIIRRVLTVLKAKQNRLWCLLFVSVVFNVFFILYFGDVDFEPDSYLHFTYSDSAFSRLPESLNYAAGVWAKPLFTLLTGAIIWISGVRALWIIKLFNTLVWAGVGLLTYRLARQLRLSPNIALISVFLTQFSFLGLRSSIGTLTEPLFTLLIMGALVALYDGRYTTCCVLVSLNTLVRSEGLILLPGWIVILWLVQRRRRFLDLVIMAVFPLLWNLWGYALTDDPTFIVTGGYPVASEHLYGHGAWFDYPLGLLQYEPLVFPLALLGLGLVARERRYYPFHILLLLYLVFHTVAWQFGLFGSAGILRYFVPVVPCLALYAGQALTFRRLISAHKRLAASGFNFLLLQVLFTFLVVNSKTGGYHLYNTPTVHHALIDAGEWIRANRAEDYLYSSHPALLYYAGRDFYSGTMVWRPTSVSRKGIAAFEKGFGTDELFDYLEHFPRLEVFGDYVYVYDHPGWASFEAQRTMAFGAQDIQPHLWFGWSDPEGWGTWAVGDYSEFALHFPEPQAVNITVSVIPHLVAGRQQAVEVYYNDIFVGSYEFPEDTQDVQQFSFDVPRSLVSGRVDVVKFVYAYTMSPSDVGTSDDQRHLAVGFLEMNIVMGD